MTGRREFLKTLSAAAVAPFIGRANAQPTACSAVWLQDVRPDRATLVWATPDPGQGLVELYGGDGRRLLETAQARYLDGLGWRHVAVVSNLERGVEYSYRLQVAGQDVYIAERGLRTPGDEAFRFLVFGDSGTGSDEQNQLVRQMGEEEFDLVLHTGDVVYPAGSIENYRLRYLESYRDLMVRAPFYPCPGNHDYAEDGGAAYRLVHALPIDGVPEASHGRYYSFDRGDVHFVSLDSNDVTPAMLAWLDGDLAQSDRRWRIAYFHHPPYACGLHRQDPVVAAARARLVPHLERAGVHAVLNGHEHGYMRTHPLEGSEIGGRGPFYITSGGGGASLYTFDRNPTVATEASVNHYLSVEASADALTIRSIALGGEEIDRVTLESPRPAAEEPMQTTLTGLYPKLGRVR